MKVAAIPSIRVPADGSSSVICSRWSSGNSGRGAGLAGRSAPPPRTIGAMVEPGDRRAGTVTVVFADLVESTSLRQTLGDDQADQIRREHDRIIRHAMSEHDGSEIKALGDGFMLSFGAAAEAVAAAVAMQQALQRFARRERTPLLIRVGISSGDVIWEGGDCFGTPVVEASLARVLAPVVGHAMARTVQIERHARLVCSASSRRGDDPPPQIWLVAPATYYSLKPGRARPPPARACGSTAIPSARGNVRRCGRGRQRRFKLCLRSSVCSCPDRGCSYGLRSSATSAVSSVPRTRTTFPSRNRHQ